MAWLSSVAWSNADTPVLATVLNNIGADIRAWGGNVDAAGFDLLNVRQITGSGGKVGIGTSSPVERLTINHTQSNTAFGGIHVLNGSFTAGCRAGISFQCADWVNAAIWHRRDNYALAIATNPNTSDLTVAGCVERLVVLNSGYVGIGTTTPTAPLHVSGLPSYASNAAAITGGLTAGAFYRNGDAVCVVH